MSYTSRTNLYENVARSLITFLTKLLVVSYDKLKKFHEYFSRPPSSFYGNSLLKASFLMIDMALPVCQGSKQAEVRASHFFY